MSRSHAHIRRIDGRFVLSDLGSVNGVRVNGEPVLTPRELADGDRIALGGAVLRFSLAPFGGGTPGTTTLAVLAGGAAPSSSRLLRLAADGALAALRGELREVTVLFADLHGFTALSERLNDPELTTGIINQVFDLLTAAIVRYDGAIDKYSGDNIMALFGAPRAHEDDPERAVRAALAMQGALAGFNRRLRRELGLRLRIRVGINTGEVLFGQVGGGAFRSYTVMGDTVNLAARLEQAARPGSILIGETTHALTRHAFEVTALPPLEVRGKREPVRAYEVARAREGRAAEAPHEPTEGDYLIGREGEVGRLRAALEDARGGRGRLLAIVGDAGIGKSQLLAGFRRSEAGPGAEWVVARCRSYEVPAPGALLAGLLRALLGLDREEGRDHAKIRAALEAALPGAGEEARAAHLALLGRILGDTAADAPPGGQVTAVLHDLVAARVRAGGGARPLVLALEKLQWADGPSVEALDGLVDALPGLPVLLLLTYRPEWRHGWGNRPSYREIVLRELPPEQSRQFLRRALGPLPLPDEVADAIYDRCGGNPRVLEETVKWLRERGGLVDAEGRWALSGDVARLGSPSALRGLLLSRLDRLAERDRAVLQRAAVIGRSFTYRLLALVSGPDDGLDDSLAALQDRGLIAEDTLATEPAYRFKQAIVQEIAYGAMLATERRALHERIGAAIERILTGAESDDDYVDVLAHHYGRGGSRRKAAEYLLRSGARARGQGANATAIARFEAALEKLGGLPSAEQAREPQSGLLLRLREALGDATLAIADFRRAQESYEAALLVDGVARPDRARLWRKLGTVWERRGDHRKALGSYERGLALRDLADGPVEPAGLRATAARAHAGRGDHALAAGLANAALAEVAELPDRAAGRVRGDALHILGVAAYAAGRPDEALDHFVQSLAIRRALGDTRGMRESGQEIGTLAWSRDRPELAAKHLPDLPAFARPVADDPDRRDDDLDRAPVTPGDAAAVECYYRDGIEAARRAGDRWGAAAGGERLGRLLFGRGEHERALDALRGAVAEANRIGARGIAARANVVLGALLIGRGDVADGLRRLERVIAYAEAIENRPLLAEGRIRLAEGKLAAGDPDGALAAAWKGLELATRLDHRPILALAHHTLGRIMAARGDWHAAGRHFRLALDHFTPLDSQAEIGRTLRDFAAMVRDGSAAGGGPPPEDAAAMLRRAARIFARLDLPDELRAVQEALGGVGRGA